MRSRSASACPPKGPMRMRSLAFRKSSAIRDFCRCRLPKSASGLKKGFLSVKPKMSPKATTSTNGTCSRCSGESRSRGSTAFCAAGAAIITYPRRWCGARSIRPTAYTSSRSARMKISMSMPGASVSVTSLHPWKPWRLRKRVHGGFRRIRLLLPISASIRKLTR